LVRLPVLWGIWSLVEGLVVTQRLPLVLGGKEEECGTYWHASLSLSPFAMASQRLLSMGGTAWRVYPSLS